MLSRMSKLLALMMLLLCTGALVDAAENKEDKLGGVVSESASSDNDDFEDLIYAFKAQTNGTLSKFANKKVELPDLIPSSDLIEALDTDNRAAFEEMSEEQKAAITSSLLDVPDKLILIEAKPESTVTQSVKQSVKQTENVPVLIYGFAFGTEFSEKSEISGVLREMFGNYQFEIQTRLPFTRPAPRRISGVQLNISQKETRFMITGGSFFPESMKELELFHNVEPGTNDIASYESFINWYQYIKSTGDANKRVSFGNFDRDKTSNERQIEGKFWLYDDWKADDIVTLIASDKAANLLAFVPVKLQDGGIADVDYSVRPSPHGDIVTELRYKKGNLYFIIPNKLPPGYINQITFTQGELRSDTLTHRHNALGFMHLCEHNKKSFATVPGTTQHCPEIANGSKLKVKPTKHDVQLLRNWSWNGSEPITAFYFDGNQGGAVVYYARVKMSLNDNARKALNLPKVDLSNSEESKTTNVEQNVPKRKQSTTSKQSSKEKSATDPLNASLTSADPAKNVVQRSRVDPLKVKQPVQAKPGSGEKQSKPPSASSKVKLGADKPKTKPYSPPELYPLKTKHDALKKQDLNEEKVDLKPAALKNKKQLAGSKLSKPLNQSNRQKLLNRQKQDGQSTTSAVSEDTKDPYAGPEDNTVSEEDIPDDVSNLGVDAGDVAQKNGSSSVGGFIFIIMLALMVGLFVWQKEYILKMFENL
eukprot:1060306_1